MKDLEIPTDPQEIEELQLALKYCWDLNRREEQAPPYDQDWWDIWLYLGGRGTGKTRSGAEFIRERVMNQGARRIHLVAPTAGDVRDVMVEGESGVLNVFPEDERPEYIKSSRKLVFHTGAIALLYSADEPERLRGPQCDTMWMDEPASWRRPDAYDMAMFGLRLGVNYGVHPRCAVTGTPKPVRIVKDLVAKSQESTAKDKNVFITRGSMLRNRANLAPSFINAILKRYGGTRLGAQEIYAKILTDNPNALWSMEVIEKNRYVGLLSEIKLKKIIVSIDPSTRKDVNSDEAGIIVLGLGTDRRCYVLADESVSGGPSVWALTAIKVYHAYGAKYILYESNQGGEMVEDTIHNASNTPVPLKPVFASDGKFARAEPVSMLYDQGKVVHVNKFPHLEEEMTEWDYKDPKWPSPNRVDALVHGVTDLIKITGTILVGGSDVRPTR